MTKIRKTCRQSVWSRVMLALSQAQVRRSTQMGGHGTAVCKDGARTACPAGDPCRIAGSPQMEPGRSVIRCEGCQIDRSTAKWALATLDEGQDVRLDRVDTRRIHRLRPGMLGRCMPRAIRMQRA